MSSLTRIAVLVATACLTLPPATSGAGNGYVFDGGTKAERQVVVSALRASSFDWSVVPGTVTIHIARGQLSRSIPHEIWLDADLLHAGKFAWGVVQHEYAHQVDYLLFTDAERAGLLASLGGRDWCYSVPGLPHDEYGCERFASTLAWAFWPSQQNCMSPSSMHDESGAMPPKAFRRLVARLTNQPVTGADAH